MRHTVPPANAALIDRLRATVSEALDPLVRRQPYLALLDFPDHGNVGDSAIWLGENIYLHAATGRSPDYTCSARTYDAQDLRRHAPEGPILLHGGGNFGDIYKLHQDLREQVCRDFPDRPIIQLPQTIHFRDAANFDATREVMASHRNFTLLARDKTSLELARRFDCSSALVPDMAFCLGALGGLADPPSFELAALLRDDREAKELPGLRESLPQNARVTDWFVEDRPVLHVLERYAAKGRGHAMACIQAAEHRLARGVEILASGRRVVTDRLHGHILCLLIGVPHFVLDNSYGKNFSFIHTWSAASEQTVMGDTLDDFNAWFGDEIPAQGAQAN